MTARVTKLTIHIRSPLYTWLVTQVGYPLVARSHFGCHQVASLVAGAARRCALGHLGSARAAGGHVLQGPLPRGLTIGEW